LAQRYGDLGRGRIATESVISPSYFEAEREAVFKRSWLLVGRESEVPNPGDYLVKRIEPLRTTVVVARDKQGALHAMHDVCPHRGMHVCGKEQRDNRRGGTFVCQFHGWVFGMDGRVVDVPDRDLYYNLDTSQLRMPPLAVDTWEGFIFVHWQAQPGESLKEFLGELYDGYSNYFDDGFFKKVGGYVAELHINYKFYLDSSVEALHAGYTHIQNNTGQNAKSGTSLYLGPQWVRLGERHRAVGIPIGVGERDLSPMEQLAFRFGGATTPYDPRVRARPLPPGVNLPKADNWAFDIVEIYPNTLLFTSAPLWARLSLWPSAHDRCRFEAQIYMPPPQNAAERVAVEYGLVSLRDVMREDLNMAEGCTDALAAGVLSDINLSDQELAVRHSYWVVDRAVREFRANCVLSTGSK
jgi:phenylpropionate dioxygenase-like ring-hydroxylating dioxygenase large terminal subunit